MDVRSQILTVATRRFARRGFDGTSLQAISDEVGVRKPSLLYHFPSKTDLRDRVLEHVLGHWQEVLPGLLATKLDGETRFEALLRALLEFFEEDPDRARLVIRELLDRPREMRAQLAVHVRPWVVMVGDLIHLGKETGEVRPEVDAEAYVVEVLVMALTTVAASRLLKQLIPRPAGDGAGAGPDDRPARQLQEMMRIARAGLFLDEPERRTEPGSRRASALDAKPNGGHRPTAGVDATPPEEEPTGAGSSR